MNFRQLITYIKCDLERLTKPTILYGTLYLITNASFRITFWNRIGTFLRQKRGFYKFFYGIVFLIHKHNQYKTGIQLPLGTICKGGLFFPHFSCIVIDGSSVIGEHCTIMQGVTIGSKRGKKGGSPIIGDFVVICSGAQIIGNVKVGNNVMIGANALVINDIPDKAVVGGNPAKILNFNGVYHTSLYSKT